VAQTTPTHGPKSKVSYIERPPGTSPALLKKMHRRKSPPPNRIHRCHPTAAAAAAQLVLFPRSNGVAILARYCNTMFGGNIVYLPQGVLWQQLLMQRCYWLQYFLLRPHHVVAFVFYARRERHSIATHQNWVAITYCNIFKCHDSQRNRLRSICYVLQPKRPYCNHS